MSKYTPGPWQAKCRDITYVDGTDWPENEFLQWEVEGPRTVWGRGAFLQGDAYLVAAAPELLQVALELSNIVREMCRALLIPEPSASLERSDAAIAKATGEPHA